jgi:hypothetical protein
MTQQPESVEMTDLEAENVRLRDLLRQAKHYLDLDLEGGVARPGSPLSSLVKEIADAVGDRVPGG